MGMWSNPRRRLSSRGSIVSFLLLLLLGSESRGQLGYSPFFVAPQEENIVQVSLDTSFGTSVQCSFAYTTSKKKSEDANAAPQNYHRPAQVMHRDVSSVFEKLAGVCIRKTMDYWKYEICFEGKVIQSHGRDSNSLGIYVSLDGNNQLYADGSPCEALPGNPGRSSKVEFVCDKNLRFLTIDEVSTCNYKLVISTPLVCGHPEFKQASTVMEGHQIANAQPWFIEVYETQGGKEVACSLSAVASSDAFAIPDAIRFQTFELALFSTDSTQPMSALFPEYHVCRARGRVNLGLAEQHYQLLHVDSDSRVIVKNGDNFQGGLEHIFIQAVPKG